MKKLCLMILALGCALVCAAGLDLLIKHYLKNNMDKAIYDNKAYTRNCSDYVMDQIIDENSIVVLGSSELGASDELAFPKALFNNGYSDFNMILMGTAHLQSLPQAINVGALQNNIKNGKIVLILSPQWFSASGLSTQAYSSRFEELNFVQFLRNKNISKQTKIAVSNRINGLLTADPTTLDRVIKDENVYLYHSLNPFTYIEMITYNMFRDAKTRFELVDEFNSLSPLDKTNYIHANEINFDSLLLQAAELGAESCTNNEFGIYDEYFNTYIRNEFEGFKGRSEAESYAVSPEYGDFRLFLDVCKETGIEPLIISVPVNGRWYDYTGFSKADRNTYYQNIRDICAEYGVSLVDFSEKEYELYFLKDIMHMGWKGWAYLDKAVYSFYKGEKNETSTSYEELLTGTFDLSPGVSMLSEGAYSFTTRVDGNSFNSVVVSVVQDNALIDSTAAAGVRSGVYLHTMDSGYYMIRFGASSSLQDEFIDAKIYLENGMVYKVMYRVDSIENNLISIRDISFSKVN